MKTTTVLAIALGLGTLAACNKSPTEQTADNIEANAESTADTMETNVDNAADAMQANTENAADAVRNPGDRASPMRFATRATPSKPKRPVRPHADGLASRGAPLAPGRPVAAVLEAERHDFADARQRAQLAVPRPA